MAAMQGMMSSMGGPSRGGLGTVGNAWMTRATGGANPLGDMTDFFRGQINPLRSPFAKLKDGVTMMATFPLKLEEWGDALKESRRELAQFSGRMAGTMLESERRGILRSRESAGRTSGSTERMVVAIDDLKDDIQPFIDLAYNFGATATTAFARLTSIGLDILTKVSPVAAAALKASELFREKGMARDTPFVALMKDVHDDAIKPIRRHPRGTMGG